VSGGAAVPQRGRLAVLSDGGDAPAAVLLHGLGGDRAQAMNQLRPDAAYRRVAFDMRGHGATRGLGAPQSLTLEDFARDVLSELPDEKVKLLGVSMGAAVALYVAAIAPERVARLVLVRPAWLDQAMPVNLAIFPIIGELLQSGADVESLTACADYRRIASVSSAMAASLRGQFSRPMARERADVLRRIPASSPLPRAQWDAIDMAALVLGAATDPVHPLQFAEEIAAALPNARFAGLPAKQERPGRHEEALRDATTRFFAAG
jgi:pimeloyl-ACP methyl ester carboxylesterase